MGLPLVLLPYIREQMRIGGELSIAARNSPIRCRLYLHQRDDGGPMLVNHRIVILMTDARFFNQRSISRVALRWAIRPSYVMRAASVLDTTP